MGGEAAVIVIPLGAIPHPVEGRSDEDGREAAAGAEQADGRPVRVCRAACGSCSRPHAASAAATPWRRLTKWQWAGGAGGRGCAPAAA